MLKENPTGWPAFETALALAWPPHTWRDLHLILAVSGGADSMALLRGMLQLKGEAGGDGQLWVVHVNHGLRAEADADAAWVEAQAHLLKANLKIVSADAGSQAAKDGDGIEAAARTVRYRILTGLAHQMGARYVATAHTADDQAETVLHRILRGTGIEGLAGIPRARTLGEDVALIRPMLRVTRQEVIDYLQELGQEYLHDTTNDDTSFTRNRIRHELLPWLRDHFQVEVPGALNRLAEHASELEEILTPQIEVFLQQAVTITPQRIEVNKQLAKNFPEPFVRYALRKAWRQAGWPEQAMTDSHWRRLSQLAVGCHDHKHSTYDLPGALQAAVQQHNLVIRISSGATD